MTSTLYDIVIRNGTLYDGSGDAPVAADVAIKDGLIAAVGTIEGRGTEEIDAKGQIVTPGFVDIHTHYDGQATWEDRLSPSSGHGVTTVVAGNCGVGFAPVRPEHRELLIKVMEGVEDVPEIVMTQGVPWNWETFPDYLDALEARSFDIDIATQIPHSPLRVYVMGDRGVADETATPEDCAQMSRIVEEAVRAGAIGVSTSRSHGHRLRNGEFAPSIMTQDPELRALARGLRQAGGGVFQLITEAGDEPAVQLASIRAAAEESGRPVSFTLLQSPRYPDSWHALLDGVQAMRADGLPVKGQVFPRPVGVLMGLDLSLHPFLTRPSFRAIEHLPLAQKVVIMRDPAYKAKILAETPVPDPQPNVNLLITKIDELFVLDDPVDYAPSTDKTIAAMAVAAGESAESFMYDRMLDDEGRTVFYLPGANFVGGTLNSVHTMMAHPGTVLGLGDGGAHYGIICDASFTTFVLTHWARDADPDQRFPLEWAIAELSQRPAETVGLTDRGLVKVGLRADINVIDHDKLTLFAPRVVHDLPTQGRRLRQKATGYVATIVNGIITYRDGEPTGALPGRLVRSGSYRGQLAQAA